MSVNPIAAEFPTADNTGDPLDIKSRKQLHFQIWERAAAAYERSEFAEALIWYNYSLSLFPETCGADRNLGRLQVRAGEGRLTLGLSLSEKQVFLSDVTGPTREGAHT